MAKEKTVELKPKVEKISKEHLDKLQKVVNTINGIQFNIGKVETQKHNLLHELSTLQQDVTDVRDLLKKEYGCEDVNVVDGTINWPKEDSDEK
tara:strand:+ start:1362 stop:1640 length:279 start_codon:yes stop_codon:yes gene_type:complete